MSQQDEDIVQVLIDELKASLIDLEGVYLFGSRNTGDFNDSSDWDFAFLSRKGFNDETTWEFKTLLESKFDTNIDLVDLYEANTILQIQVLKTGKLVWIGDDIKVKHFEYLTLSYYQKLNDERAEILKDVELRGNIYG